MNTTGDPHGILHQGRLYGAGSPGAVIFGLGHGVVVYAKRATMWELSFGLALLLELSPEEMGAQKKSGQDCIDEAELKLYLDNLRAGFDYRRIIISGNRADLRERLVRWWSPSVLHRVITLASNLSVRGGDADYYLAGFWEAAGTAWKLPTLDLVCLFSDNKAYTTASLAEKYAEFRCLADEDPIEPSTL